MDTNQDSGDHLERNLRESAATAQAQFGDFASQDKSPLPNGKTPHMRPRRSSVARGPSHSQEMGRLQILLLPRHHKGQFSETLPFTHREGIQNSSAGVGT